MLAVKGMYQNGKLTLEEEISSDRPIKVIVTFLDEIVQEKEKRIDLSKFSFMKAREALKDFRGSLSEEVIKERREQE